MLLLDHAPAGIPNYGISYSSLSMTNMVHFDKHIYCFPCMYKWLIQSSSRT